MESRDIVLPVGTDIPVERGRVGRVVLHLGPDLREAGGMAHVINSYV